MNFKVILFLGLLGASLFLLGCADSGVPSLPYSVSQFVGRTTDLNYTLFQSGYYDGNCLTMDGNKISVTNCLSIDANIPWDTLIDFPAGCGVNQAVKIVGTALVCVDLPVDTNWQTSWALFDANMRSIYPRLDGNNQPFTGNFEIEKVNPAFTLTDSSSDKFFKFVKNDSSSRSYVSTTVGVPAVQSASAAFNGSSYVSVPDDSSLDFTTGLSASIWVKLNDQYSPGQIFAGKWNATGDQRSWFIGNAGDAPYPRLRLVFGNPSNGLLQGIWQSNGEVLTTSWQHVAFTFNAGTLHVYLNGSEVTGSVTAGSIPTSLLNSSAPFTIGGVVSGSYLLGNADEALFFNRALTLGEVQDLYNSGSGFYTTTSKTFPSSGAVIGDNLAAGYHFDSSLSDFTANGNNGSSVGSISYNTSVYVVASELSYDEAIIIESNDGSILGEKGIHTFGNESGRTVLDGKTIRFNIDGTEKGSIDANGNLQMTGYKSSDGNYGITNTSSYWLCTDLNCLTTCQVHIEDGLIVGCT